MLIKKDLFFDEELEQKKETAITQLAKAVKSTLGPGGKPALIERKGTTPLITKDGVTVAKNIVLKDPLENVVVQTMLEAAEKTNTEAGDGPQPLYSKVLTPRGWLRMDQLEVGTEICGTNNTKQTVLAILPKGEKEIHKVHFQNGSTVHCCDEHLWTVTTNTGQKETLPLKDIISNFEKNGNTYYVQNTTVEFEEIKSEMPLDSYLLGTILGNRFEINGMNYHGQLCNDIRSLGLLNTNSSTKFIPKSYLYSSKNTRLKLLQGLLDSDGCVNKNNLFEFRTTSEQLYEDFIELTSSLGIYTENNKDSYTPIYKVNQIKGDKYGLKIVDIEKTNKYTPMQCIKVSNDDHLYITDNYIPTHNTSSAIVLAEAIYKSGIKAMKVGASNTIMDLNLQIKNAVDEVLENLENKKKDIETQDEIKNVGTISANGDEEIGELISSAIDKVGEDGLITLEESGTLDTFVKYTDGFEIPKGYLSNYFITNEENRTIGYSDVNIFLYDGTISDMTSFMPVIQMLAKSEEPFLIIAHDVKNIALDTLILNRTQADMPGFVVKAPHYGPVRTEVLKDIAVMTGATVIQPKKGDKLSEAADKKNLGKAKSVLSTANSTKILNGCGEKDLILQRVEMLDKQIDSVAQYNYDKEILRERISRMTGGAAVISVGASTEMEMKEKKDRIEDALNATRSAIEEGILPGGGIALMKAAQELKNDSVGHTIIKEAIQQPFKNILMNAGQPVDIVQMKVLEGKFYDGFDARKQQYGDMYKLGVIDPFKVVKNGLINSSSIATLLLNNNVAIVLNEEKERTEIDKILEEA